LEPLTEIHFARINTRIEYDRSNDCRIEAESFIAGKRVWLPDNRVLDLNDPNDRTEIDKIYASLRLFVAPLKINDKEIAAWLVHKRVSDSRRYFVQCVENAIIRQIKDHSDESSRFLYNAPKAFQPICIQVAASQFAVIGLTTPTRAVCSAAD
jgi:hypothetical protein